MQKSQKKPHTKKKKKKNIHHVLSSWDIQKRVKFVSVSFKYQYKFQKVIRILRNKAWSVHNCHAEMLKASEKKSNAILSNS